MNASTVKTAPIKRGQSDQKEGIHNGRHKESPHRDADPLVDMIQRMCQAGERPFMEDMARRLAFMPPAMRHSAAISLQRTRGNRFVEGLAIQAKMAIGAAGNRYDQETNRVADQVMMTESPGYIQRLEDKEEDNIQAKSLVNRQVAKEDEELQMMPSKSCPECEEEVIQTKFMGDSVIPTVQKQLEPKPNLTGMPGQLKAGIESLSGIDMSDVRVHANSNKPAHLNALAYAQGNEIHLGPGQERHLAHEAWHVVQQKQGQVRATTQIKGQEVNDDLRLEMEADRMGGRAVHEEAITIESTNELINATRPSANHISGKVVQPVWAEDVYRKIPDIHDKHFDSIRSLLESYQSKENQDDGESLKKRMEYLYYMEQEAYNWYAHHKGKSTKERDIKDINHETLMLVINDVQAERRKVVQKTVERHGDIWVPGIEKMKPAAQSEIQNLWTTLTTDTGKLRIKGNSTPEARAKVHADYLQLLSGKSGRQLLASVTTGNKGNQSPVITIDPNQSGEPKSVESDETAGHLRLPLGANLSSLGTQRLTLTQKQIKGLEASSGSGSTIAFKDAPAMGGDSAIYARGKDWKWNKDKKTGGSYYTGSYELMPSFLTLGHELGHAYRAQSGIGTKAIVTPESGETPSGGWDSDEEYRVIRDIENKIRKEHNLGARKFHRGGSLAFADELPI